MAGELEKTDTFTVKATVRSADTGGVQLGLPLKPADLGTLGPYRVIRAIGHGGMGIVFLAIDPKLRRKVALKVMLPKFLKRATARERFLREARALAAVKNDHVVTIYQVDESEGVPYLALEYLQGATLEEYLRAGQPLTMTQLIHVARDVALGLAAAHEHGVIHRDIKPENIWLEAPEGRVKLIDFGLARLPMKTDHHTVDGMVLGTPAYMSPEQARGLEVDARSDLFSLGGVIYRLVAGEPPFRGDSPFALVLALSTDAHIPLIARDGSVPEALSQLVDHLLAKDPAQRPGSAREVAKELKKIEVMSRYPDQSGEGSRPLTATAIRIDAVENAWAGLETESPSGTPSQSSRIAPPVTRRLFWGWILFTAASVMVLTVLTISLLKRGPAPEGSRKPTPAKTP